MDAKLGHLLVEDVCKLVRPRRFLNFFFWCWRSKDGLPYGLPLRTIFGHRNGEVVLCEAACDVAFLRHRLIHLAHKLHTTNPTTSGRVRLHQSRGIDVATRRCHRTPMKTGEEKKADHTTLLTVSDQSKASRSIFGAGETRTTHASYDSRTTQGVPTHDSSSFHLTWSTG